MKSEAPIYVVGFPKSGNTWLLRMLCDILDANIDQGDEINRADYVAHRERVIHKRHFEEISDFRPDGKIIYIARDVRDVLVSGFFHFNRNISEDAVMLGQNGGFKHFLLRCYFRRQIKRLNLRWQGNELAVLKFWMTNLLKRLKRWITKRSSKKWVSHNWSDHILYWSSKPGVHVVRYEDLLANPRVSIENILRFLGTEFLSTNLDAVIQAQSFQNKIQQFENKGDTCNVQFMRKGQSGDWVRFLDDAMVNEIIRINKEGMQAMGYIAIDWSNMSTR